MARQNAEFALRGINHLALVCRDMRETVTWYQDVLGMPLVKTIELPGGMGQHFFLDAGNETAVAFFWFPDAPAGVQGVSSPDVRTFFDRRAELTTAVGSMNHVAFDVRPEQMEAYRERLIAKGVKVTPIINHDDSPTTVSRDINGTTFVRSMYFFDPNGILLEFAAWTRALTEGDVRHAPATARDRDRYVAQRRGQKAAAASPAS